MYLCVTGTYPHVTCMLFAALVHTKEIKRHDPQILCPAFSRKQFQIPEIQISKSIVNKEEWL